MSTDQLLRYLGVLAALLGVITSALALLQTVPRRWFGAGLALFAVGAVVVWQATTRTPVVVTVQIWDVEHDEKHAVIASQRFIGRAGGSLSEETRQSIVRWVGDQIEKRYDLNAPSLQVRVRVPADPRRDKVEVEATPPGPVDAYFSVTGSGGKARVRLDEQALAALGRDFDLEISRPGYTTRVVRVTWGQALDVTLTLEPRAVGVGVQESGGEKNTLATWLADVLAAERRIAVKDPQTLEALRARIERERAGIARNPAMQVSIPTSLGIDLIVTGTYEKP
ncbi:MAG: hypothetical protein QN187_14315 [Armatimonadota bacterium]|nr:hypothetical protein [Armatimonadota bacterium]MDR7549429.1 hypothetical protein [Armatimonadota bacterium]